MAAETRGAGTGRSAPELRTPRLWLRRFKASDELALEEINRDPEVTRYLSRPPGSTGSRALYAGVLAHWERHGFGLYAVESREPALRGRFLGFIGLAYPTFVPELSGRPEIGWRLARAAWGRGLATEGAVAVRDLAFEELGLPELISIIHPQNARSQRVAEKLGMTVERDIAGPLLGLRAEVWHLAATRDRSARPD